MARIRPDTGDATELTEHQVEDLLVGSSMWKSREDLWEHEAERERTWRAHADVLTRWWRKAPGWEDLDLPLSDWPTVEPAGPGFRCQAWWDYVADEQPKFLGEPEPAYLARHDLLSGRERYAVGAEDFVPEPPWRAIRHGRPHPEKWRQ